ncbi:MAG: AAA-like domain-containing protein [Pyrinomonadaceae bacterium]|nr:AAA-like domain-containing protein [Pyrinomonadaceae bacterium]
MSSDPQEQIKLEIAHVLFTDIVGYSKLPMDQQTSRLQELNRIVRETEEFRRAEAADQLIRLPTGDGMALVFFGDPELPLKCALAINRALRSDYPHVKLRMGVHTGPIYRMADINTSNNVAGGGINIAQRVMDCGDDGHILVSNTVAEMLGQLSRWAEAMHDLGEAEVKHGVRVRVFNVYGDGYGNAELPAKLQPHALAHPEPTPAPHMTETPTSPAPPPPSPPVATPMAEKAPMGPTNEAGASRVAPNAESLRVALLYKRNAQPDEHVLKLLEGELQSHGHKVFIDRHLSIGVEWAKEIERQVRTADAVVPILSAASAQSEMVAYEVQIAHEAAQQHEDGRPRILPVRVDYEDALPDPLGGLLAPIQYFLWSNPGSDPVLVKELLQALEQPSPPDEAVPVQELKEPGGAVPLDSKLYVVRPTDDEFLHAIKRRDSIVLVKGARQMGKTSLLARGIQHAREAGTKVVITDFQTLNAQHLASIDALFQTLAGLICDQLDLDVTPEDEWNPKRGASINFARYMRRHVLGSLQTPLVWAMDEVDRLFACDFGSEVFGLFRSWHNERSLDPASPWERLTLAIVYATEAHLFITDQNQSPFNVGTRLELSDFSFDQVSELNARFVRLVGGHPYLVHRGLYNMKTHGLTLAEFENLADRDEGPFGDHLRRILVLLARDPALTEVVREVLRGRPSGPTTESFYRLRSAGVMAGDSAREAKPRCQLYANYLERHLL